MLQGEVYVKIVKPLPRFPAVAGPVVLGEDEDEVDADDDEVSTL